MNYLIFFIFILVIVVVWLAVTLRRVVREEGETKMQINLDRIMSLFNRGGFGADTELTNTEIRKALGVSSRTVVRYMDALERAGLVVQTRKFGPLTTYVLKK